ncbi:hypothetical protein E3N88_18619 [Mikania micrantha]|uniref:Uncharacterized protein n=1 Tax=Mikania micrantha TaxID=192012 RepID=A0A5N6NMS0_9ASTR|nr:hypothetical protein E3N88_18619 [Mikania micrantha]
MKNKGQALEQLVRMWHCDHEMVGSSHSSLLQKMCRVRLGRYVSQIAKPRPCAKLNLRQTSGMPYGKRRLQAWSSRLFTTITVAAGIVAGFQKLSPVIVQRVPTTHPLLFLSDWGSGEPDNLNRRRHCTCRIRVPAPSQRIGVPVNFFQSKQSASGQNHSNCSRLLLFGVYSTASAVIRVSESNVESCVMDTSASFHATHSNDGMRNVKEDDFGKVRLGNGELLDMTGMGD